jgi:very-short-patch-repair endonuclease
VSTPNDSTKSLEELFRDTDPIWETEFFQLHGGAAVQAYLDNQRDFFNHRLRVCTRNCESPLEAAFVAWWMVEHVEFGLHLHRQVPVVACGHSYRLDFTVGAGEPEAPMIVAVEMDGHEFHERTKDQVTLRNRRDRDLQADGWSVFHVSGSEFNASPRRVVRDVLRKSYRVYHVGAMAY